MFHIAFFGYNREVKKLLLRFPVAELPKYNNINDTIVKDFRPIHAMKIMHRKIYYYSIIFLVISLPLSIYFTSFAEIILLLNWLLEGGFRRKYAILKRRKGIILIVSLYLIHLAGVFYSDFSNLDYLLKDLKVKLPILIIPLIVGTSGSFSAKELKNVLLLFCMATLSSTLISFGIFIGLIPYEYYDFREISIFISHIRLALMVNLSVFILIYYAGLQEKKLQFSVLQRALSILIILWFVFFLVLLKSLTGLFILMVLGLVYSWIYSSRINDVAVRFILRTLIFTLPLTPASYITHSIGKYYYREPVDFSRLGEFTPEGNPYFHDTLKLAAENGNYVWLYISEKELEREWDKLSQFKYRGYDRKGQRMKYTLIRYMTSKGLRKDAAGVSGLSKEDITAIENGHSNYIFTNKYSLYPRIYQVIWEIDGYLNGGDPSGHSIAQRIAYLDAAGYIIRNNLWIGVGTGDVQSSFDRYYEKSESKLDSTYRRRAHNQYVTFVLTFGILGFLLCVITIFLPVFLERKWRDQLFLSFFSIALLSMLNEDTLETQTGVSFFIVFYSLLLLGRSGSSSR